jgi:hypothetical protein
MIDIWSDKNYYNDITTVDRGFTYDVLKLVFPNRKDAQAISNLFLLIPR